MTDPAAPPTDPPDGTDPLVWTEDGLPRSALYGDVYFSSDDGLAESRAVFLTGCGLPEAWAGRRAFTVAELGFGTGLNIAALLKLWSETREAGAHLCIFSVEAHPIDAEAARRALSRWPDLGEAAELLLQRWPGRAPGFHRVDLPELGAALDLAVMPAQAALAEWTGAADAWFLDGFSPALNPAMWSEALMAQVAARSAPGARAATFTVAGGVRRGLAAAGFAVDKRPGFGRKRERLEAVLPGEAAVLPLPSVAVLGAGIAGASLARAFRVLGAPVTVFDPRGAAGGASGNPAALVTPRLDAGLGPTAGLFAQAFARAVEIYRRETPGAVIAEGALQLQAEPRDERRFATVAAAGLFEPGALLPQDEAATAARLGEPAAAGLLYRDGLVIEPAAVLPGWCGRVVEAAVAALEGLPQGGWRLLDAGGGEIARADVVCVAAGIDSDAFAPLPLSPARGQASWTDAPSPSEGAPAAAAFGGYAIPTRAGVLFGATFDRGQRDEDVREEDHARNLATLAKGLPRLAERLEGLTMQGRARIRATTPDHLPLAGGLAETLFVLSGLGARGFTLAPLLAEHVAALALGAPSPLPAALAKIVRPDCRKPGDGKAAEAL